MTESKNRVISDFSRFEFQTPSPNISRPASPAPVISTISNEQSSSIYYDEPGTIKEHTFVDPSLKEHTFVDPGPQRRRNLIEIAEAAMSPKKNQPYDYEDIYKYYEKQSVASEVDKDHFSPYPETPVTPFPQTPYSTNAPFGISTADDHIIDHTITNQTLFINPITKSYKDKDLPPIMNPQEYYQHQQSSLDSVYKSNETTSLSSRQKRVENHLVKSVMNNALFTIPTGNLLKNDDFFENDEFVVTANFILYFFEFIVALMIAILSGVLLSRDHHGNPGVYRYFIVDSVISMIISLLFITTIINFEKRNGSFYCTAATILSLVSFVMTISYVIPNNNCPASSVCSLRKANSAFVIISFFLWLTDLVMFLTTLYISRLNLLEDINFEYSSRGLAHGFNKSLSSQSTLNVDTTDQKGQPLKEYYLTEAGEMYELSEDFDISNKNKIIVYTV